MTADYASRCMLYLSGKEGLSSSLGIGETVGINKIFVQKVLRVLRDAGIVSNTRGGMGGCRLTRKPEEIVLFDIILLFEKTMKINCCLEPEEYCDRCKTCSMRAYYKGVQKTLEDCFGRDTL